MLWNHGSVVGVDGVEERGEELRSFLLVPAFGLAIAVVGASTRSLGNRLIAVPVVIGGLGYALAGATFLFTDRFDSLFPTAGGIGVWAVAVAIGLALRWRSTHV